MFSNDHDDSLSQRSEEVRTRLEPVLVEVVPGPLARPKDEVAFEVRVLAECALQLVVGQRAARRSSRASGSSRSASGDPFDSEIIEPSW